MFNDSSQPRKYIPNSFQQQRHPLSSSLDQQDPQEDKLEFLSEINKRLKKTPSKQELLKK